MSTREVFNPATGERFWFSDETNDAAGRVRSLRYELLPGNAVPFHYHPGHAQRFEVLAGQLHIRVDAKVHVLTAGQSATCAPSQAHTQWNEGPDPVLAVEHYEPPLDIEPFFTHLATLGERGELKPGGAPANPLKFATFVADFRDVTRLASPPLAALVRVLGLVGRCIGLRGWYKRLR